jgi:hypothetical protein
MKNMKFLKLFEAFESETLSKVFNYVNKSQRGQFKNILMDVCRKLDFPMSKLSDDLFQYLSFKKGLYLTATIEDQPCENESDSIPGEKCSGPTGDEFQGTILRTWGRGRRRVECPVCKGTGIKPKTNFPIKWIKFWFDKDGKYVTATITDGQIRKQHGGSQISGDYDVVANITNYRDLENYKTGNQFIFAAPQDPYDEVKATLWIWPCTSEGEFTTNSRTYMIQDQYSGNSSDTSSYPESKEWRQFGKYSWIISSRGDFNVIKAIKPKSGDKPEEVNPYTWNANVNLRNMNPMSSNNMKDKLKDAHFALVLDYVRMKEIMASGQIQDVEVTKQKRETSREGALALQIPDEIRAQNYDRYINKMASNIQVDENVSNLKRMFTRILGMDKAGYYILQGLRFDEMRNFLVRLTDFMESSDDNKEYHLERVSSLIKSVMSGNKSYSANIAANLDYIIQNADTPKHTDLVKKFIEVNRVICEKISNAKVETIEDLIVLYNKIRSIRFEYRDNPLFAKAKSASDVNYYLESDDQERCRRMLSRVSEDDIDGILRNFDSFIKFIQKL